MSKYAVTEEEAVEKDAEASRTEQIKAVFSRYDLNGDGCISCKELGEVLRKLGHDLPEADLIRVFTKMDSNKDNRIQYGEFVDWIFNFADISDAAEMEVRAAAAEPSSASGGEKKAAVYQRSATVKSTGGDILDVQLDFEEPDLPKVVAGLQSLGAKKLREVFEKTDVSKRGFLRLADIRHILFPYSSESPDDSLAAVKVFGQMDRNSDGKIHCGEFVSFLMNAKSRLGKEASDADKRQIASAFSAADEDHSNTISQEEFEHMFGAETQEEHRMLREAFEFVDKNGDGNVSIQELAKVYGKELVKDTKGVAVSGSMDAGDDDEVSEEES